MESFNVILYHKSGPANKQYTYQSINQSITSSLLLVVYWLTLEGCMAWK